MIKAIIRIVNWTGSYKKRLLFGVVLSFFSSLATAAPTMIAAWVLGKVLFSFWYQTELSQHFVMKSTIAITAFVLLRFILSYWQAVLQESIGYEVAEKQRLRLGKILKRVSLSYFAKHSVGDILAGVTTELSTLEMQSMLMVDTVLNGYIHLFAVIICLWVFDPIAAGLAIGGVIISAIALKGINQRSKETAPITHKAAENMSDAVVEYVHGLHIVKSFGANAVSMNNYCKSCNTLKRINFKIEWGFVPYNCIHLLALKLTSMGLVLLSSWRTYIGQMDITVFLMFVLFSFIIFGSIESINDAAHVLAIVESAMDKLEELESEEYLDKDGCDISISDYTIQFNKVSFGYNDQEILHDICVTIPANKTTAIVGPSGSGKTTLCNLIPRFYDVKSGEILIGGVDVRKFTCDSLLKNISMVFQNVYLFRDTVKNNIRFGKPEASDEEVILAAKAARCHDFISALPDGYDSVIEEGGSSLSGGEKQRISIARAILKNAPIIILDEATASVDPENEHLIQQAISELTHGKTIIIIAHRLATIKNADQILVVDKGKIVQKGMHQQLILQEGIYRHFISICEQAEGWSID